MSKSRLERCLDLMSVERKGIYARDIDTMLSIQRRIELGRLPTKRQLEKLGPILDRVEQSKPRRGVG